MKGEDQLQSACVKWFKLQYPDKFIFHVPNGGKRNVIEAAKFKRMGVLSGIPDIMIIEPRDQYSGLAIELKSGKNKPTDNQIEIHNKLTARNWMVRVVYSLDEFMTVVGDYLNSDLVISA